MVKESRDEKEAAARRGPAADGRGDRGAAVRAAEEPAAKDAVFKMEEVSAFDVKEVGPSGIGLVGGPIAMCTPTPDSRGEGLPKLKAKRPLYGRAIFGGGLGRVGPGPAGHAVRSTSSWTSRRKTLPRSRSRRPRTPRRPGTRGKAWSESEKKPPAAAKPAPINRSRLGLR